MSDCICLFLPSPTQNPHASTSAACVHAFIAILGDVLGAAFQIHTHEDCEAHECAFHAAFLFLISRF